MMTRAYNNCYLEDVMSGIGAMLDYAVRICGQDLELFWARFLASGVADQFSRRNPRYLCGLSGTELALKVAVDTGDSLPVENAEIDIGSPEYWTGWTLAYLQWYLNRSFAELEDGGVGISDLRSIYPTLHEADLSRSLRYAEKKLAEAAVHFSLKKARKNAGLSQQELSERSGIPIRTIRAYEQRRLDLANAGTENVRNLRSVLGLTL